MFRLNRAGQTTGEVATAAHRMAGETPFLNRGPVAARADS